MSAVPASLSSCRSEPPKVGVDVLAHQGGLRGGPVEVGEAHVLLGQALGLEQPVEGQLVGGAAQHGHALALQVLEALDVAAQRRGQVAVGAAAGGGHQPGLEAAGAADDGGQVAQEHHVELPGGEALVDGGAGALEELPFDLHAVLGELGFDGLGRIGQRHRPSTGEGLALAALLGCRQADGLGQIARLGVGEGQRRGGEGEGTGGQELAAAEQGSGHARVRNEGIGNAEPDACPPGAVRASVEGAGVQAVAVASSTTAARVVWVVGAVPKALKVTRCVTRRCGQ